MALLCERIPDSHKHFRGAASAFPSLFLGDYKLDLTLRFSFTTVLGQRSSIPGGLTMHAVPFVYSYCVQ
jgi:hypothetical protein